MYSEPPVHRRQVDSPLPNTSGTLEASTASETVTTGSATQSSTFTTSAISRASATQTRASFSSGFASRTSARPTQTATASPSSENNPSDGPSRIIIPLIVIVAVILLGFVIFQILRTTRRKHSNPKYVPTQFLKNKWRNWHPPAPGWKISRGTERTGNFEPIGTAAARRLGPPAAAGSSATRGAQDDGTGDIGTATVDRNTSVRSVMTLPAYRMDAHHNEQVLGREGERGGIDVVLEFPETADEEERAREEEMAALYQVRLARRRENEEREERRRLRREARERGDLVALREIQERSRAANAARAGQTADELRAEHERIKRERTRAVSSVSYGDLGIARHDGTRIRANSEESERTGLLGDAASFGASSRYHRRDRSTSSVLSIDTMNSDLPSPEFARARADSQASGRETPLRRVSTQDVLSTYSDRAGSSPELIEHEDIPPHSPPRYGHTAPGSESVAPEPHHQEPPPDYTSPIIDRGQGRSLTESRFAGSVGGEIAPEHGEVSSHEARTSSQDASPSRRGVGGVPQLPSLRLSNLPSIQVDPGSPRVGRGAERSPR